MRSNNIAERIPTVIGAFTFVAAAQELFNSASKISSAYRNKKIDLSNTEMDSETLESHHFSLASSIPHLVCSIALCTASLVAFGVIVSNPYIGPIVVSSGLAFCLIEVFRDAKNIKRSQSLNTFGLKNIYAFQKKINLIKQSNCSEDATNTKLRELNSWVKSTFEIHERKLDNIDDYSDYCSILTDQAIQNILEKFNNGDCQKTCKLDRRIGSWLRQEIFNFNKIKNLSGNQLVLQLIFSEKGSFSRYFKRALAQKDENEAILQHVENILDSKQNGAGEFNIDDIIRRAKVECIQCYVPFYVDDKSNQLKSHHDYSDLKASITTKLPESNTNKRETTNRIINDLKSIERAFLFLDEATKSNAGIRLDARPATLANKLKAVRQEQLLVDLNSQINKKLTSGGLSILTHLSNFSFLFSFAILGGPVFPIAATVLVTSAYIAKFLYVNGLQYSRGYKFNTQNVWKSISRPFHSYPWKPPEDILKIYIDRLNK